MEAMIKRLLLICLALGSAHCPASGKHNVLFIAIDDMNDWIGPLGGHPQAITPNLDRLAKMGVTFRNAHTASPACHSSRVAIMTGVRPSTSGITANVFQGIGPNWRKNRKLAEVVTLSQHFRNNGYVAVGGGKIYHSLQSGHLGLLFPRSPQADSFSGAAADQGRAGP